MTDSWPTPAHQPPFPCLTLSQIDMRRSDHMQPSNMFYSSPLPPAPLPSSQSPSHSQAFHCCFCSVTHGGLTRALAQTRAWALRIHQSVSDSLAATWFFLTSCQNTPCRKDSIISKWCWENEMSTSEEYYRILISCSSQNQLQTDKTFQHTNWNHWRKSSKFTAAHRHTALWVRLLYLGWKANNWTMTSWVITHFLYSKGDYQQSEG